MSGIQIGVPRPAGALAAPEPTPGEAAPPELTPEQEQFAKDHPAGKVAVSRGGDRAGWRIGGGVAGLAGGAIAGIGLMRGGGPAPLIIGGALAAVGLGAALIVPSTIEDTQRVVVASRFQTRTEAQLLANSMVGRRIEVVEAKDGTFAIADTGPVTTSGPTRPGGYPGGYSDYYPYDPHWGHDHHGHGHYGHDHHFNPYPQYYPGFPDYGWDYGYDSYPSVPGGGSTSPGDDYPY